MPEASPISHAVRKRQLTRSRKARLLPQIAKLHWREKVFNQLTAGMSVSLIAAQEGLSIRRMREIIQEILAARRGGPADGFAQLQMARLGDAMIVAPYVDDVRQPGGGRPGGEARPRTGALSRLPRRRCRPVRNASFAARCAARSAGARFHRRGGKS
jgi:hypothetical protein